MAGEAAAQAFEAIDAALAVLRAEVAGAGIAATVRGQSANDPLAATADECLDILAGVARTEARVAALKAEAAATYADSARSIAPAAMPVQAQEMAIAAEIGCVLAIGDRAAGALLAQSYALATSLPLTLEALKAGTISWQHARVMVDETATLAPDAAAALEKHFLDPDAPQPARGCPAGEMPAYRFRRKARGWRERNHPDSIEQRHAKGAADRCLEFTPEQDGMARISAYLPADKASAIWNRFTAIARGLQGPNEKRTLTQLRADLFAATSLSGGSGCTSCSDGSNGTHDAGSAPQGLADSPAPRAEVLVTVPVFSLLGATDEVAMLDGYGPIPASMARELVANGADSFYRVLVDPRDGAPLEIGRTSYRLTKGPCEDGSGYGTASVPSPAAAIIRWITKQIICSPGIKAGPLGSVIWVSRALSTTGSGTLAVGGQRRRRRMNRPAGFPRQGASTGVSIRIGSRQRGPSH